METIEEEASSLYKNLPYHNFEHVLDSLDVGMEVVWRCFSEGVKVNAQVVYYAILFHDAGYHRDHKNEGYDSKEDYSAHLAKKVLSNYSLSDQFIDKVQSTIQSTRVKESFDTNEEKVVRAADLYSLSGNYKDFKDNNIALKKEKEILEDKEISWKEWKEETKNIIKFYLNQNIRLTSHYENEDGRSLFHRQAQENLQKFLKESDENLESREEVLFPEQ